jgi:hypothetical protein
MLAKQNLLFEDALSLGLLFHQMGSMFAYVQPDGGHDDLPRRKENSPASIACGAVGFRLTIKLHPGKPACRGVVVCDARCDQLMRSIWAPTPLSFCSMCS